MEPLTFLVVLLFGFGGGSVHQKQLDKIKCQEAQIEQLKKQ